jgi:metal-dependent amidase/aminoacylase/carboxypeptidase family protein
LDKQVERVKDIVKGAALMTGTTVKIESQGRYDNCINVDTLEKIAFQYAKEFGAPEPQEPDPCPPTTGASTDFGTVSYNIPSITVQVKSAPAGCPYHSQQMEEATVSELGHKALPIAAKVEAALALDLLTKPGLIDQIKKEHAELKAK